MRKTLLSLVLGALSILPSSLAAPAPEPVADASTGFPVVDAHLKARGKGWGGWSGWSGWSGWGPSCNSKTMKIRKDFDTMAPQERKAYTDAVKCLRKQPSQLNQQLYPAATDRFMDYAVIHVNRTKVVHLDGFFLTWHRYFLWLYEKDLEQLCGYKGSFPYWNWPATADNLKGSPIFSGDDYSMSGDGLYTGNAPIILSPNFQLPHGSGGGCVTNGPFANWQTTMADIPISIILQGQPLPPTAFQLSPKCLTRDLNTYVAQTWCNYTALEVALQSPTVEAFSVGINGILGGGALGLHSGAHFIMGAPASSLFVSPQDPIWYPLHAMLDNVYTSWQARHPEIAYSVFGTETAANIPPSANATLDSIHPDWSYLQPGKITIRELMSTTAGPFCYKYDRIL